MAGLGSSLPLTPGSADGAVVRQTVPRLLIGPLGDRNGAEPVSAGGDVHVSLFGTNSVWPLREALVSRWKSKGCICRLAGISHAFLAVDLG